MKNEYAEAVAARATDALAKERADNAAGLVALLEQANKEKRAVEAERDKLRTALEKLTETAHSYIERNLVRRAFALNIAYREALAVLGGYDELPHAI